MDMIAVDPKLFITCRLCLEEMGQYQIVPSVQQQIKYCFDFEVEPFDGLPQLICVKCKDILSNYMSTKKTFKEKQDNLKQNLLVKKETLVGPQPQQDTVSSTQTQQDNIIQTKTSTTLNKRLLLSSSSDDSDSGLSYAGKQKKKKKVIRPPITWESDYKKLIICRLCNSNWPNTRSMKCHYNGTHKTLKSKYNNIFTRYCTVNMKKLDDKPNITGLSNMVVHSKSKIIQSSSYYYILYSKVSNVDVFENSLHKYDGNSVNSDSTDDSENCIKPKTQRNRRLLSRSSNDTVVLETHSNKVMSDDESNVVLDGDTQTENQMDDDQCINIDDTTDSESEDKSKDGTSQNITPKKPIEAQLDDYKTIQGIINTCVYNHRKKKDELQTNQSHKKIESRLKHIILSIGRKIIHPKQGININCMGLLRYMEQKDLEIQWFTKTNFNKSFINSFVRIYTKLKVPTKTNDGGWVNVYPSVKPDTFINIDNSVLYTEVTSSSTDNKNKLLNANPVANPKQLPKKSAQSNETRSNKTITHKNMPSVSNDDQTQSSESNSNTAFIISSDDNNLCMPIITSTTSLAEPPNKEQSQKSTNPSSEITKQNTPRIKVKPVSELMPKPCGFNSFLAGQITPVAGNNLLAAPVASNSLLASQLSRPQQSPLTIIMPNLVLTPPCTVEAIESPIQIVQAPSLDVATPSKTTPALPATTNTNSKENRDYLTLDTVELPNTKTDSPLKYFKNLLHIHNLLLLDPNETLSQQFACLIKFKVVFKQETKEDQPVVLCLSLFCLRNMYCLKVRDIDIYKISANWQWEILQIYTGEVVGKLLENAQKVNRETYDNTNNFLCLLKSIKLKKE